MLTAPRRMDVFLERSSVSAGMQQPSQLPIRVAPFLGAELRVRRARQLIGTLKKQLQAWANAHRDFITAEQDSAGNISLVLPEVDIRRLGRMSVTIGETIYNLRAALDYVTDLAAMGQGAPRGTQFPIEDTQTGFLSRVTGKNAKGANVRHFLKGVPPGAIPRRPVTPAK